MKRKRWLFVVAGLAVACGLSACGSGSSPTGPTDQAPPVIDGVRVTRSASNQVLVEAQVYDDSAVASVQVLAVDGSLLTRQFSMQQQYGNRYSVTLPENILRVTVSATDTAGRTSQSREVLVPPPNPPSF
ncbi:MAG: hypothetical protein RMM06_02285 [Armatimonadota bacterium]|nr:hypothetical protein [bacterium]MDW8104206.1 hypothetical protein [Armatimonadota bacterium]MDW8289525.1 hypothetical protein [Armatimonadota bacterium]